VVLHVKQYIPRPLPFGVSNIVGLVKHENWGVGLVVCNQTDILIRARNLLNVCTNMVTEIKLTTKNTIMSAVSTWRNLLTSENSDVVFCAGNSGNIGVVGPGRAVRRPNVSIFGSARSVPTVTACTTFRRRTKQ